MAAELTPLDVDDLVERYTAGEAVTHLARVNQCSPSRIRRLLVGAGVEIRPAGQAVRASGKRRVPLADSEIVSRYQAGESELSLSEAFAVSRSTIRKRLEAAGAPLRSASEANRLRMQRLSFDERAALAASANAARRGGHYAEPYDPVAIARAPKVARTREVTKSATWTHEDRVIATLQQAGHIVRTQAAVHSYNLDIAVGSVAVEVHTAAYHPGRHPRLVRRAVQLGEAGWHILYVWITRAHPYAERCGHELVAHIEALHRLPSGIREERVVRGSGELAAVLRVDFDQRTLVPAPVDPANG